MLRYLYESNASNTAPCYFSRWNCLSIAAAVKFHFVAITGATSERSVKIYSLECEENLSVVVIKKHYHEVQNELGIP